MGCGASSLTRVEDYVPADDVSTGCVSHVSDQHLDDTDIASLVSEPSSAGYEATERPSLLKMKLAARVLHARVRYGINDDPNQFEFESEWHYRTSVPNQNRRKQKAVAQFIDDHVQSIVRLELDEEVAYESLCESSSPGMSGSTSCFSTVSGSQLIPMVAEEESVPIIHSEKARPQPASTHYRLPLATLRGHLDYDLLSMAAEREGTGSLPLGRFLKHRRRKIRQLSEVFAQREQTDIPLASQLRLATAQLPTPAVESPPPPLRLTVNLLYDHMVAFRSLEFGQPEGLRLRWVVSGCSNRQQEVHSLAAVIHRRATVDDGSTVL